MFLKSVVSDIQVSNPCFPFVTAVRRRLFLSARHIVMGGGAVYGVMYLGVLMELCSYSKALYAAWASKLVAIAGTSAGTVVGIMVAAGMDPWEMRTIMHRSGLSRVFDSMLDISLGEMQKRCAVGSGTSVDDVAKDLVRNVTGNSETTFAQFFATTKREFVVVVTNAQTLMAEFWSHKTKPQMELWRAIRCSTSIPGLFPPPVIDDVPYFDGGLTCNLPCHLYPPTQTLSLFVHTPFRQPRYTQLFDTITNGLAVYMSAAQLGPMRMSHALAFRGIPCSTFLADTGILGPLAFDATPAMFDALIDDGTRCARSVFIRDMMVAAMLLSQVFLLPERSLSPGHFQQQHVLKKAVCPCNHNDEDNQQ